jgi:hypothetical protein
VTGARDIGVGVIGVGLMGRRHAENCDDPREISP